jgi:arsenate reductase
LGPALRADWGVDDPARAIDTNAETEAAFEQAYRVLSTRVEALLRLLLTELRHDVARFEG